MYRKILYVTAFEKFYQDVLSCALSLKKAGAEEVVLLHVIYSTQLPKSHEEYVLKLAETLRNLLSDRMDEAAALVEAAGMKVKKRIELGVPYQEILRVAKEENVSLIVAGRERKGFLDEVFVGSITDKIIRHGTTPVYIPKYPGTYGADRETCEAFSRNPFRLILYPTDWSDCAREALDYVKQFKTAGVEEVIVAHIMDEKAMKLQPEEKFREFERVDKEKLEKVELELEKEGFCVKTLLRKGNPRADLIGIAKEEDVSLIVIGSHGKGRAEGILWGSVSRNVSEYSDRPVLVVKSRSCAKHPLH
jgi:nucleotide-binding universal stress UspA family protein